MLSTGTHYCWCQTTGSETRMKSCLLESDSCSQVASAGSQVPQVTAEVWPGAQGGVSGVTDVVQKKGCHRGSLGCSHLTS